MAQDGGTRLPLFPLGLVLFPGLVLPLHVFEERYRVLVRELLALPEADRRFGVVAIREGREVGVDGVQALHEVGCVAHVTRVQAYPDGRYDVVSVGAERFRLDALHDDRPYLSGDVALLPDDGGDPGEAVVLQRAVAGAYVDYLAALGEAGADEVDPGELPREPGPTSYLVAATMLLDLHDRQELLAADDDVARLRRELGLLRREATLLRTLSAVPAPELARTPLSLN